MEEKKTNNENFLKSWVDELQQNMSKLFSSDKSTSWPEKIDSTLSDFEDETLKNFRLQKDDEDMESSS